MPPAPPSPSGGSGPRQLAYATSSASQTIGISSFGSTWGRGSCNVHPFRATQRTKAIASSKHCAGTSVRQSSMHSATSSSSSGQSAWTSLQTDVQSTELPGTLPPPNGGSFGLPGGSFGLPGGSPGSPGAPGSVGALSLGPRPKSFGEPPPWQATTSPSPQ